MNAAVSSVQTVKDAMKTSAIKILAKMLLITNVRHLMHPAATDFHLQ